MTPKSGNDDDVTKEDTGVTYIEERNVILKDIPYKIVRQAWFTLSHILLDAGSTAVHLGCEDGRLTYAMAALNPSVKFIGVDKSKKVIKEATSTYQLDNLEFKMGDISGELFEENSLDAIINSFTLHQVYSNARYNQRIVSDTLRKHFTMLKNDGVMFIQDYAKPSEHEYVLMEMHDKPSHGEELADLSEADLLSWYSEHAQPKQDPGCGGFFLEELPPRFPRTRLFRLPYKWAYEFIMRKDNRDLWEKKLPFEFTFFTVDDFKRELRLLGAQMLYSAPHWDEEYIRKNFEGHFRLMQINGETLGDPATSFISVSRKRAERSSLNVQERRLTQEEVGNLDIKTLRNQKDGTLVDVVTRDKEFAEILPYRIDDKGRLFIYLHDGIIRGISNTINRSGENIDGRQWSGHMLESISVDYNKVLNLGEIKTKNTAKFIKSYIGLKTRSDALLEQGAFYYPDPNYIDERVTTYYVQVDEGEKRLSPKSKLLEGSHFQEKGTIRELNAQNVLDAIAVGLVPNSRLELQILSLMQHAKVKAENWIRKDVIMAVTNIIQEFDLKKFTTFQNQATGQYKEVKGSAGQLKTVNSIFVEEGQSQGGATGISAEPLDFVLSDENTINTAVVLPLAKSIKGDIHAGFMVKSMPVPERFEGKGMSLSVPQFNIPKEIKNFRMLKQFVAEKMGIKPDMVIKLGESYYTHIGITPQRIHPFAVFTPQGGFKGIKFMPIYRYMLLWKSLSKEQHFMTLIARSYRFLPGHMKMQAKHDVKVILDKIFKDAQPDWSLPASIPQTEASISSAGAKSEQSSAGMSEGSSSGGDKEERSEDAEKTEDKDKDKENELITGIDNGKEDTSLELKKKKKRAKKKKRKLGIGEGKGAQIDASTDQDDQDSISEKQSKLKPTLSDDDDMVDEFEDEIESIRKTMEDDSDLDPKPKPEHD